MTNENEPAYRSIADLLHLKGAEVDYAATSPGALRLAMALNDLREDVEDSIMGPPQDGTPRNTHITGSIVDGRVAFSYVDGGDEDGTRIEVQAQERGVARMSDALASLLPRAIPMLSALLAGGAPAAPIRPPSRCEGCASDRAVLVVEDDNGCLHVLRGDVLPRYADILATVWLCLEDDRPVPQDTIDYALAERDAVRGDSLPAPRLLIVPPSLAV